MRQYKFRVWDKSKSYWSTYVDLKFDDQLSGPIRALYVRDNSVIQQSTGLKDKNGREIYEGDILKVSMAFMQTGIPAPYNEAVKWWDSGRWNIAGRYEKGMEVIGNIFENPELLK